jgi:hypothetical protein
MALQPLPYHENPSNGFFLFVFFWERKQPQNRLTALP